MVQNIDIFPNFLPLNEGSLPYVKELVGRYDPYSDINITSLLCWGGNDGLEVSALEEGVVIKMLDYITQKPVYTAICDKSTDASLKAVLSVVTELVLVPGAVVRSIQHKDNYLIVEDRDNFDYIYRVDDLAMMNGGAYIKKRNKINRLLKDLGTELSVKVTEGVSSEDREKALAVFEKWANRKAIADKASRAEREALARIWDYDNPRIIIVWIMYHGEIVGFSINELLNDGYAICHFEKVIQVHKHINTYVTQQVAIVLTQHNIEFVNWEQDLGLAGLRASKESYHPERYLKKYTIRLA